MYLGELTAIAGLCIVANRVLTLYRKREDPRPKVVLITGCGGGLGKALAVELMTRGDFVIGADIQEKVLDALSKEFPAQFLSLPFNVAQADSVRQAADRLFKYSGKPCVDVIVNSAGVNIGGPLTEVSHEEMAAVMNINVMGALLTTRYFFPLLIQDGSYYHPRIINFSSEVAYARVSAMFNGLYGMSKYCIEAFSESLRQELLVQKKHLTHVVVLNPGPHATNMTNPQNSHTGKLNRPGSRFDSLIQTSNQGALSYIKFFVRPAEALSQTVFHVVHQISPPMRVKCGVSIVMEIMRFVPQWMADLSIWFLMGDYWF